MSAPKRSPSVKGSSNIFHELLDSEILPESDKSLERLKHEALIIIAAGTVTTSWTLCVAIYHLLSDARILRKLKDELATVIPRDQKHVPVHVLEKLPYLTAIIQETLRLSYGVSSRLARISPNKPLVFTPHNGGGQSWVIPPGTPVGMTSVLQHHDESIFPDSHSFVPERWLDDPKLGKYLVSFSKGSRHCLGVNLAYAELYLCLSALFCTFGSEEVCTERDVGVLELFETGAKDVEIAVDGFIPMTADDSKGVRVKVRSLKT